jgi:hypothetical protein
LIARAWSATGESGGFTIHFDRARAFTGAFEHLA